MSGDLGSDAGRARSRPSFLPPVDGYPPLGGDVPEPASEPVADAGGRRSRAGAAWTFAMIAAASALLVSAFLPWAHARVVVELFGQPIGRDLGSVAGIDADTMVLAVPVLGVVSIALAFWDLIGRDARIGGLAAIPGTLALLVCGIFVLRLSDVRDNLPETGLDLGYQITVRYGWYLAVVMSLLVVGFSLARPISERVSRPGPRPDQHYPQYQDPRQYTDQQYAYTDQQYAYTDQQYAYTDQQYSADPYAAWPQDDQAWARPAQEPAQERDEAPPSTNEPGGDEPESDENHSEKTPRQEPS